MRSIALRPGGDELGAARMEERPAKQVRLSEPSSGGDSGAAAPAAAGESSTITQRAAAEGWSASVGGRVGRRYVPVGAICCGSRHTQPIRKALESADWLKKTSQRIHAYRPPAAYGEAPEVERRREMAIHVSPVAAAALDAAAARVAEARPDDSAAAGGGWGAELPPELGAVAALLHGGEARWLPGLRIGDAIDAGGLGPTWHLIPADIALEEERLAATQAEEARKGGSFAFIELFAGIGGFRVAMEPLGGRCVFASEIGVEERLTYFQNFGRFPAGDITETPSSAAPAHAMLTAGFPCQVIPTPSHLLDRISPIFSPFFPVFGAFSPSRRGGSNKPKTGIQGQETVSRAPKHRRPS